MWESLTACVALRLWAKYWQGARVRIRVRGDSVAMLTLVLMMKSKPGVENTGLIAREIALDVAGGVYAPAAGGHVPGVANTLADSLSRRCMPADSGKWAVPKILRV